MAGVKRFTIMRSACVHIQNKSCSQMVESSCLRTQNGTGVVLFFSKSTILHVVNLNSTVFKLAEPGVDVPGSIPRQERVSFCHNIVTKTPVCLGFGAPSAACTLYDLLPKCKVRGKIYSCPRHEDIWGV